MYDSSMASDLTRLTVNLIPKAVTALDTAVQLSEDSRTDTINRALQVYAYLLHVKQQGGSAYVRESADAELSRIEFL